MSLAQRVSTLPLSPEAQAYVESVYKSIGDYVASRISQREADLRAGGQAGELQQAQEIQATDMRIVLSDVYKELTRRSLPTAPN